MLHISCLKNVVLDIGPVLDVVGKHDNTCNCGLQSAYPEVDLLHDGVTECNLSRDGINSQEPNEQQVDKADKRKIDPWKHLPLICKRFKMNGALT